MFHHRAMRRDDATDAGNACTIAPCDYDPHEKAAAAPALLKRAVVPMCRPRPDPRAGAPPRMRLGSIVPRLIAAALALFVVAAPAGAAQRFQLDQRYGSIAFSVSNLGLFRARGQFGRFVGRLAIDPAHPTATRIAVTVAAGSVQTPWGQETAMLRSADFFDVARYKVIRFASAQVLAKGPGRYLIRGALTLRGRTLPVSLAARLVHAARDPRTGRQIDDFIVTGSVSRRAFGMTADPLFIADRVEIAIHARIILGPVQGG